MPLPPFDARDAIRWFDQRKSDRSSFETTWQAIRRVFFPGSQDFVARNDTQGKRDRNVAVDGHGILALQDLADYICASLANPAQKWLTLVLADGTDPSPAVREWLDAERDDTLAEFHDPVSFFDDALRAAAKEFGAYGNGPFYTGDRVGSLPLFMQVPLAQCVWELDGDGNVMRFGWKKRYSPLQASTKFPVEKLSKRMQEMLQADAASTGKYDFLHVMDQNPGYVPGSAEPAKRQYRTRWIEVDQQHVISEQYLEESCYAVFAAPRMGDEDYGRGCGDAALEDCNMAQRVRVSTVRGMEKAVDPTSIVPDDGIVSMPTSEARGVIVVRSELMRNGNVPVATLRHEGRPELGIEVSKVLHESIDRHMYVQQTRLPREPRMPTSQIVGLQEEAMRTLGPLLTSFQRPLGFVVLRVLNIRRRAGRTRPLPADMVDLDGRPKKVALKMEPPALRQMRMAEVRAFMQWLELVGAAAQIDQGVIHIPNLNAAIPEVGLALGVPQRWISSADDVKRAMASQAATAEEAADMEQLKDTTTAAKNVAPLLKVMQGGAGAEEQRAA